MRPEKAETAERQSQSFPPQTPENPHQIIQIPKNMVSVCLYGVMEWVKVIRG